MDIRDKVVLVTGGTAGIGNATVRSLAEDGARIVFNARRKELGDELERELADKGLDCLFVQGDASKEEDNKRLIQAALDKYGKIDAAILNAGQAWKQPFHEISSEDWENMIAINMNGAFYLLKELIPQMMEQKAGSVVFLGSGMTTCPLPELGHYICTKAALESLARCLSLDYCRYGIRFNTICPGPVRTDAFAHVPPEAIEEILKTTPTHDFCKAEDVIRALKFLIADDSRICFGTRLTPDLADGCGVRFD